MTLLALLPVTATNIAPLVLTVVSPYLLVFAVDVALTLKLSAVSPEATDKLPVLLMVVDV
jgi:hypothetical protein